MLRKLIWGIFLPAIFIVKKLQKQKLNAEKICKKVIFLNEKFLELFSNDNFSEEEIKVFMSQEKQL